MFFVMGGKKRESAESQLVAMDEDARDAFDRGDKERAAEIRERMVVVAEANDMSEEAARNKLSAVALNAGYDSPKEYLKTQGWNRSVDDYIATELAGQKTSLGRYLSVVLFSLFTVFGVLSLGLNVTGNVIGNSSIPNNSLIGVVLLLIGLVGLLLKK